MQIKILLGDITEQDTCAIVNAANTTLLGGGGVDGAIHKKAGPRLLEECKTLGGCRTGEAKITKGYDLKAKYVIHTVGPVYGNGGEEKAKQLASCYKKSLELAAENRIKTISFPAISTGAYGYPVREASLIAINEVLKYLSKTHAIEEIRFVLFSEKAYNIYKTSYEELMNGKI
ncbi:MAG: O-acetyl-ADP-ribose deacetylase [Proteobacteria bacterium]|nr:O-acetyl-ADP-ribose deacetylase [Pseudomonadota bacterium]